IKDLIESVARSCGFPFVANRWLGGVFTNFDIMKKRIQYFKELELKKSSGELEKYTKKEKAEIDKEIRTLEDKFGGIKNMEKLPDAVFVADMKKDPLAVREAKAKKIKVIGIADTNINPDLADYFIPANDDAISSVKYILEKIQGVILKNKK
ncbi:MAG: 30S ribosomal protein S2, partial [Patescibacteria group bacterium]